MEKARVTTSHQRTQGCLGMMRNLMMTSSNGNLFRVTGPLWGESTGHWWIPLTKASDAGLWFLLICTWTNGWVSNRDAGDLRRHRAHYDVSVMHGYDENCVENAGCITYHFCFWIRIDIQKYPWFISAVNWLIHCRYKRIFSGKTMRLLSFSMYKIRYCIMKFSYYWLRFMWLSIVKLCCAN